MKKFTILALFVLSLSSCTIDKNANNSKSKNLDNLSKSSSKEIENLYIALGAKIVMEASDETLVNYFKAYCVITSKTTSTEEKAKAAIELRKTYYKAILERQTSKNSPSKLTLCNNTLIIEDLSVLDLEASSHESFLEITKLPTHRAACVLRFLTKIGLETTENELAKE